MQTLEEKLKAAITMGFIPTHVKPHIQYNLNQKFSLRPYQKEAFARFNYYLEDYPQKIKPVQLMFHMATGSGKTLVMAGAILDLYLKGYRNFIFFVNSNTIIDKTRDNFLNPSSTKYLFNNKISIDGKPVDIVEVDNFEAVNKDDINIVFTTIHGLHGQMNNPKENQLTYEDFEDKRVVLLSDEAHHINAETKKGNKTKNEEKDVVSWEQTVDKIIDTNSENILLEFTATIDLHNEEIYQKYKDKLLFDYPLKQFRKDKYSKEIQVLQAELPPFERALQAIIVSQYRRKIFESNHIHIKPVILFKSKRIKDSQDFYKEFLKKIQDLKVAQVEGILASNSNALFLEIGKYLKAEDISTENFILELQEDFSEEKCLVVDSKSDNEEKQLILNSLEDKNNEYRGIFAVDKLNEGWDVLNLFDIVRLYNTRDADHKTGKIGKTTMSEAQLIGRGARYCPFKLTKEQPKYQRKYDEDLDNPLRICEELYYHSAHNPKYISELNKALEEIGIKASKTVQRKLTLKESFKDSDIFKTGVIYTNEKKINNREDIHAISKEIRNEIYKKKFLTGYTSLFQAFGNNLEMKIQKSSKIHNLKDFEFHILRKALQQISFFEFSNLKRYFPNITSITEFLTDENYLGDIQVEAIGTTEQVQDPNNQMKLEIALAAYEKISKAIPKQAIEFKGSKVFKPRSISQVFENRKMNISINESSDQEFGIGQSETTNQDLFIDLSKEDWYVFNDNYGTSEEKYFVKFIKQALPEILKKFDKAYLLRNEKHFQLYTFEEGQAFEPDFLLYLKKKVDKKAIIYQLFIEPKGADRLSNNDSRIKEKFLLELKERYELHTFFDNKEFTLLGMPLYNETQTKKEFKNVFESSIGIS